MLSDPNWDLDETGRAMVKAADVIRDQGLCKFVLEDDRKRHCFYGAIMVALCGDIMRPSEQIRRGFEFGEIAHRVTRYRHDGYLPNNLKSHHAALSACVMWNNLPSTTAEEVEQALREGAHCREDVLV
jgi:hypothetical protein